MVRGAARGSGRRRPVILQTQFEILKSMGAGNWLGLRLALILYVHHPDCHIIHYVRLTVTYRF